MYVIYFIIILIGYYFILFKVQSKNLKLVSLEEALGILMSGFLRGGVGFLKGTGEIIKGSSGVNREVRVGVTHVNSSHIYLIIFILFLNRNFILLF